MTAKRKKKIPEVKPCGNCYGKGYRTAYEGLRGSSDLPDSKPIKRFDLVKPRIRVISCSCERGKMIDTYFNTKRKYK